MQIIPAPRPGSAVTVSPNVSEAPASRPPVPVRKVGPGRLERGYQRQVASLRQEMESLQALQWQAARELETAQLVERGTARYVDRIEHNVQLERRESRRLLVLVGSLQHQNEQLQGQIAELRSQARRIQNNAQKPSWWQRLALRASS